jgi:hypothetical protein
MENARKTEFKKLLKILQLENIENLEDNIRRLYSDDPDDWGVDREEEDIVEIWFSLPSVSNDETDIFRLMNLEKNVSVMTDNSCPSASGLIWTVQNYDGENSIIIDGIHEYHEVSDESNNSNFTGMLTIIKNEKYNGILEQKIKIKEKENIDYIAGILGSLLYQIKFHTPENLLSSPVWGKIKEINLHIAG